MNSTLERIPDTDHHPLSYSEKRWRDYLGITPDQIKISSDHRKRLALTRLFHQYQQENKILFHLTVTYKPYQERTYTAKITNDFFINFYLKSFLPLVMKSKNYHTPSKRQYQPICFAFLEEHEQKVSPNGKVFPDRLHHHAILAVHPSTYLSLLPYLGECRIPLKTKFSRKVMTTHLRECEPMTLLYATDQFEKYGKDFLSFPDRFNSKPVQQRDTTSQVVMPVVESSV
jgi:hypothetical protein